MLPISPCAVSCFRRVGNRGFSLIELLLVLGIVSVLLVAAFWVYGSIKLANQVKDETENFNQLYANLNTLVGSSGGKVIALNTTTLKQLFALGVFPKQMQLKPNSAFFGTSWGSSASMTSGAMAYGGLSPTGRPVQFQFRYDSMPPEICMRYLPAIADKTGTIKIVGWAFTPPDSGSRDGFKNSIMNACHYLDPSGGAGQAQVDVYF